LLKNIDFGKKKIQVFFLILDRKIFDKVRWWKYRESKNSTRRHRLRDLNPRRISLVFVGFDDWSFLFFAFIKTIIIPRLVFFFSVDKLVKEVVSSSGSLLAKRVNNELYVLWVSILLNWFIWKKYEVWLILVFV